MITWLSPASLERFTCSLGSLIWGTGRESRAATGSAGAGAGAIRLPGTAPDRRADALRPVGPDARAVHVPGRPRRLPAPRGRRGGRSRAGGRLGALGPAGLRRAIRALGGRQRADQAEGDHLVSEPHP